MKTNFSLLFYMKKPKNYQKGVAPIYLRITVNGNRSEVTTGRSCETSRWNARVGRANGNKEEIKTLNTFLDHLQIKVYEAHGLLMEADEIITAGDDIYSLPKNTSSSENRLYAHLNIQTLVVVYQ